MIPSAEQFQSTLSDIISSIVDLRKLAKDNPERADEMLSDLKKCEDALDGIRMAFDL